MTDYIGTGIVKDKNGKEFEVYPHRFLTKAIVVTIQPEEVPIAGLAKDYDTNVTLSWYDDEFTHSDTILKRMIDCHNNKPDNYKPIYDNSGFPFEVKIEKITAEYMAITKVNDTVAIASVLIDTRGNIRYYWVTQDFRGSKELRCHMAILLLNAMEKGHIVPLMVKNGLYDLSTKVDSRNIMAIKAQTHFGFTKYGQLETNGVIYNHSGQSVKDCIQHTKELIEIGV